MALRDVTVTIDLQQSSGLLGFGKPIVLGVQAGGKAYEEYSNLTEVKADFDGTVDGASNEIKKIYNMAKAIFEQEHAPKKIGIACHPNEKTTTGEGAVTGLEKLLEDNYDKDFYFVLATTDDADVQKAIADYVETNGRKMFITRATSDVDMGQLDDGKYERTVVCYHATENEYMDAALVGECGSQEVGSITWKFKNLKGITAETYTSTELTTIHGLGAIAYVTKAGDEQTSEGIVVKGEYIDIIHARDFIQFNIENRVQKLFNTKSKIPYTNNGIAMIENEVLGVLQSAYNSGIIAENDEGTPLYSTNFPGRSEVSQSDRGDRKYNVGTFEFELAGAVHECTISGSIII